MQLERTWTAGKNRLHIADVGDGLCMLVNHNRRLLQVDCGTVNQRRAKKAAQNMEDWQPTVFVLSHFRLDHYNGLTALEHRVCLRLAHYPGFPSFEIDRTLRMSYMWYALALKYEASGLRDRSCTSRLPEPLA